MYEYVALKMRKKSNKGKSKKICCQKRAIKENVKMYLN